MWWLVDKHITTGFLLILTSPAELTPSFEHTNCRGTDLMHRAHHGRSGHCSHTRRAAAPLHCEPGLPASLHAYKALLSSHPVGIGSNLHSQPSPSAGHTRPPALCSRHPGPCSKALALALCTHPAAARGSAAALHRCTSPAQCGGARTARPVQGAPCYAAATPIWTEHPIRTDTLRRMRTENKQSAAHEFCIGNMQIMCPSADPDRMTGGPL